MKEQKNKPLEKPWVSQKLGKLFVLLTEKEREEIIQKLLFKYEKTKKHNSI